MSMINKAVVMERYRQLLPVFAEFDKAGIPFVVQKGVVLSKLAYGDPFSRVSGDIDLLLPREYLDAAKAVFHSLGFAQQRLTDNGLVPLTRREQVFHLSSTHQAAPFYTETGSRVCPYVCVDVNLDIFWGESGKHTDMVEFLGDRKRMELFGNLSVPCLTPEKNLLVTCLHHYKDMHSLFLLYTRNGYPVSHLNDIAGFLSHTVISTDLLIELARRYGAARYLYACLDAASRLLAGVPSQGQKLMDVLYSPGYEQEFFLIGLKQYEIRPWPDDPAQLLRKGLVRETLDGLLTDSERDNIRINAEFME